jgi:phenylpyruvate tautomerase PptA (4-oxalocrotonate tautomerase family)
VPVIKVEALPQALGVDVEQALAELCAEVAAVLDEEPRGTWATWRTLEHYLEGGEGPEAQPASTHPPLVRVIAFEGRPAELVAEVLRCVANVLARELRLEEGNVFVLYEEAHRGRLYTGGDVVGA